MSSRNRAEPPDLQFETFGCRLNAYESEAMRAMAEAAGLGDAIIVNSCAVTAEAVRQSRQAIRRLRKERPDARIIVTGCAAQTEPDTYAAMDEVDLVLGNGEKMRAETWSDLAAKGVSPAAAGDGGPDFGVARAEKVRVADIAQARETAGHLIDGFGTRARAYVQVQNGCDHRCTFCIIPYGRGPSRSAPAGGVVEQIRRLVDSGYREVVLTGVDLTSWGADLPGKPPLGDLVQRILKLAPDLPRLRISSIDSIEVDGALLDAIESAPRLTPHLHLSLQAGDDMILKRMKRRHLRDDAIRFCQEARARRPDMVFGADLITGFPTETEEMFENTLDLVEACGLTYLHVFPFSARKGTPAARMPQLGRRVAKERAARLRAAGAARLAAYLDSQVGRRLDVLMESERLGRTAAFAEVAVEQDLTPGEIAPLRITGAADGKLLAEPAP